MGAYNFKREAKVYIVQGDPENQYNIDISDINFSQTFTEETYTTRNLHTQAMFEGSVISKANPANFEFTFPAIREDDFKIVFDKLLDYQSFDLYISTLQDVFKLRNCVITNGTFIIERLRPLSMTVSGEASELSRLGDYGATDAEIPGTPQPRDANMTYNRITSINITLGNTAFGEEILSTDINNISIELQNKINWTPNNTIGLCRGKDLSYPSTYFIDGRVLAGSITRYLTDTNNTNLLNWSEDVPLFIEVGQKVGGTTYGFSLDMENCSFTNRLQTGSVFTQSYEWRLTQNPTALSDIVTYTTY